MHERHSNPRDSVVISLVDPLEPLLLFLLLMFGLVIVGRRVILPTFGKINELTYYAT